MLEQAQAIGATPFHVPGADLGQHDDRTGFDAIITKYNLTLTDPALLLMADIVRSADKKGNRPEGAGVVAISRGFAAMDLPDDKVLELESPAFEALYRYCRSFLQHRERSV